MSGFGVFVVAPVKGLLGAMSRLAHEAIGFAEEISGRAG
ncbi:hypothetical protein BH20ACT10_BH20ACT10_09920 [soil metagenome]|jgi:hypothetical protein